MIPLHRDCAEWCQLAEAFGMHGNTCSQECAYLRKAADEYQQDAIETARSEAAMVASMEEYQGER